MTTAEAVSTVIALLKSIASAIAQVRKPIQVVHVNTTGAAWNRELKVIGTACRFRGVAISNKHATDAFWVWVCDGEGVNPCCAPLYVPALSTQSITWESSPKLMRNGIYLYATSTAATNTPITTNEAFFDCSYDLEL
jgi:hypothetical protein